MARYDKNININCLTFFGEQLKKLLDKFQAEKN